MRVDRNFDRLFIIIIGIIFIFNINISYAKPGINLKLGDYIKFGHYYDEPILWRVIKEDVDNHRVMLISDRILALKAFDASSSNGWGCNKWNESNIRDWLNSESIPNLLESEWTHHKPINPTYNNYVDEAGFLSNFLEKEKNVIVKMNDNEEKDENGNKVTFLSRDELYLLLNVGYNICEAKPTEEAVLRSKYKNSDFNKDSYWQCWTRSPSTNNGYHVCVTHGRDVSVEVAFNGKDSGVRPVIWLDISSIAIDNMNGDTESEAYSLTSYEVDNKKPEILNSKYKENVIKNSVYKEEQKRSGITAVDNIDGDITSNIVISGDVVDTSKLKDYTIRYNVMDSSGNKANEVTRIVHVVKGYIGYEVGTSPKDKKYFKYYMGLDKKGIIRCMLVCADGGNDTLKRVFEKGDIIDLSTYKFKTCYYINEEGKIKKYN